MLYAITPLINVKGVDVRTKLTSFLHLSFGNTVSIAGIRAEQTWPPFQQKSQHTERHENQSDQLTLGPMAFDFFLF